jgi:glycine/D-amino acid oxidase-like deaminating enzyme
MSDTVSGTLMSMPPTLGSLAHPLEHLSSSILLQRQGRSVASEAEHRQRVEQSTGRRTSGAECQIRCQRPESRQASGPTRQRPWRQLQAEQGRGTGWRSSGRSRAGRTVKEHRWDVRRDGANDRSAREKPKPMSLMDFLEPSDSAYLPNILGSCSIPSFHHILKPNVKQREGDVQ